MVKFENGNIRISVRNLVKFILRSGDIDNRYGGKREKDAMQLGSRIHRKIQGRMGSSYRSEVPLKLKMEYEDFHISVEGRADGIITPEKAGKNEPEAVIDEIKSMYADVSTLKEPVLVHKAQAMCYGYIYGVQNKLSLVGIRMTYVNIENEAANEEEIKYFNYIFTIEQLEKEFTDIVNEYYKWAKLVYDHMQLRNKTAKELEFPFEYREGQKTIAVNTYRAIKNGVQLYIQAPTGVGKTMSVIFPAVKSIGEGITDKIFYLTAKTITGTVAYQAYRILREKGLKLKTISITAKEKICSNTRAGDLSDADSICAGSSYAEEDSPVTECNPLKCERAKGHFDRVNKAVFDLITHEDDITRETVKEYALRYNVCPFEMCLDASYFADAIICDYNYAFDPNARLKRYFAEGTKNDYVFLVDEAHNLIDRAREMYSATLCKENILEVKRIIGTRDKRTTGCLERCNRNMLEKKRMCGENMYILIDTPSDFILQVERAYTQLEKILEVYREFDGRDKALRLYFDMSHFLAMYDVMDEKYETVARIGDDGNFYIHLMCINPSGNLKACMDMAISTIMYSGTLLPVNYYKLLLSGSMEDYAIYINSPFSKEKRLIAIGSDVSTKYTKRGSSQYEKMADYIWRVISAKVGNYMVFFPSYRFLEDVRIIFTEKYGHNIEEKNIKVSCQSQGMTESEREEFLRLFENTEDNILAFCIMGGIFSEGIDLTNERLIGTIIAGTGFPQICMDREIIKNYFDGQGMNGFDFAYRYPGMNKVLQAAGRVIRTTDDVGVILLLDDRFLNSDYRGLFPREWEDRKTINISQVEDTVSEFWNRKKPEKK